MIKSFKDKVAADFWNSNGQKNRPFCGIDKIAMRKLFMLDSARDIEDLRLPPGNRLEMLSGNRTGYYSIRINIQWRICFRFENGNAESVEIIDYH